MPALGGFDVGPGVAPRDAAGQLFRNGVHRFRTHGGHLRLCATGPRAGFFLAHDPVSEEYDDGMVDDASDPIFANARGRRGPQSVEPTGGTSNGLWHKSQVFHKEKTLNTSVTRTCCASHTPEQTCREE